MIRGIWTRDTIGWVIAAALLPVAAVLLATEGATAAGRLGAGLAAAGFWQIAFRLTAGIPFSPAGAVTAVALALLAPPGLAAWQIALGASFGVVMADLIFGGWGRNVIAAPAVALSFLFLSFPSFAPPAPEAAVALAAALSGLILLATGILSLRVAATAAAACAAALVTAGGDLAALPVSGAFVFGLVFLIGDPAAASATPGGRLLYGALAGGLAGILAGFGPGIGAAQPVVFAALLAQVFAPLLDHLAVSASLTARARRNA